MISLRRWLAGSFAFLLFSTPLWAAPKVLWSYGKADGIAAPESAYYDESTASFYVSNIAGEGTAKDGIGWISRISGDGKSLKLKWVDGLNAPKGMRSANGTLWVTDIDELVSVDMKTARILKRYPAPGAKFLNDVAISDAGTIYVSDTIAGKIYRLADDALEVFMEGPTLEGPNGLLMNGDSLMVASWGQNIQADWSTSTSGRLFSINLKTKALNLITAAGLGNLDGLEKHPDGGYILSDWVAGKVLHVDARNNSTDLISGLKGAADLGLNAAGRVLVVPAMAEDRVIAYKLK